MSKSQKEDQGENKKVSQHKRIKEQRKKREQENKVKGRIETF